MNRSHPRRFLNFNFHPNELNAMINMEHAVRYLTAVEKKNREYFTEHRLKITDCVTITNLDNRVSVNITNSSLPADIKDDIKAMFWI